ncbi:flavoprotein [Kribbella catacumbae]|uniref:flavoprotein n=1 Tax=Kribbella catacumbae TaxID=460086 RepID=UPI0003607D0E|nr:flavoprotein [Kribbella catacumbae]
MLDNEQSAERGPVFRGKRLLILGTGSVSVNTLPSWLQWLGASHPDLEVRCVLTASAERFVSRYTVSAVVGQAVAVDRWSDQAEPGAPHVEYSTWPDGIAIYPATFHFVSRFALGLGDTPVMLAAQCTRAVLGLAASLPPGADTSTAYLRHLRTLDAMRNVVVAPPTTGFSLHLRREEVGAAVPMWDLLRLMEKRRVELEPSGAPS